MKSVRYRTDAALIRRYRSPAVSLFLIINKGEFMRHLTTKKQIVKATLAVIAGSGIYITTNVSAEPRVYAGGAIGWDRVNGSDFDDNNPAYKIMGGVKFNDYVGAEVAFNEYGEAKRNGSSSKLSGNTAAAVVYLPMGDNFELFAKAGNLWWRDEVEVLDTFHDTLSGNEIFYGLGANFNFNETLALRLEMERYKVDLRKDEIGVNFKDTFDVDVASVALLYRF
jgi:OmpA-OmpF porin, OOP family